jgi:peptide/nickel transport system ATP-binding protein
MTQTNEKLLDVRNVCVDYLTGKKLVRAVDHVSIDIKKGETLGLAGESGCGKSTLAFSIARLHKPPALISEGEILFGGEDVLCMDDERGVNSGRTNH